MDLYGSYRYSQWTALNQLIAEEFQGWAGAVSWLLSYSTCEIGCHVPLGFHLLFVSFSFGFPSFSYCFFLSSLFFSMFLNVFLSIFSSFSYVVSCSFPFPFSVLVLVRSFPFTVDPSLSCLQAFDESNPRETSLYPLQISKWSSDFGLWTWTLATYDSRYGDIKRYDINITGIY